MKQRAGQLRAKDRAYATTGQGTPVNKTPKNRPTTPPKGGALKSAGKVGKAIAVVLAGKALYDTNKPTKRKK